jgi:hypothetical protein
VLDTKSPKYLEMAQGHISLSLYDQINLGDYPYLVRGYPSNHVGFVSYRLEMGPGFPLYI